MGIIWSNDDDDNPGETPEVDYLNNVVDGEGDLLDFFPVFLDIKQLLTVLPPSATVKYKLKHADGGLNFVYTNLTKATAFSYQTGTLTTGFGPSFTQAASVATTQQITTAGIELPAAFLTNIKDNDQGVILVEARQVSGAPLLLVVEKDNVQIAEVALNIASLRLYADSGTVHLGFDPPNKSELEDLAAPSTYWASVVQGTTNTILNLDLPASALAGVEWKIAAADTTRVDISPKTFTSATTKLTIEGLNTGAATPEPASITLVPIGGNGTPILTLKILVLPQREIKLAIYTLEDPDAPLTQFASAPVVQLPSNEEILAVCNEAYRQAGVRFSLHSSVLPPNTRNRFYPYDTRGVRINETLALGQYDATFPDRTSDGVMSYGERLAFYTEPNSPNSSLFDVPVGMTNGAVRLILVKQSGVSYANATNPPIPFPLEPDNVAKVRGMSSGEIFARDSKTPLQIALAIAHEVGHKLGLATANELSGSGPYKTGGHDQPPHPYCVCIDNPNGAPPVHPGNELDTARPFPNRVLMQGGSSEDDGLPWLHGLWMRREDWAASNLEAGGIVP